MTKQTTKDFKGFFEEAEVSTQLVNEQKTIADRLNATNYAVNFARSVDPTSPLNPRSPQADLDQALLLAQKVSNEHVSNHTKAHLDDIVGDLIGKKLVERLPVYDFSGPMEMYTPQKIKSNADHTKKADAHSVYATLASLYQAAQQDPGAFGKLQKQVLTDKQSELEGKLRADVLISDKTRKNVSTYLLSLYDADSIRALGARRVGEAQKAFLDLFGSDSDKEHYVRENIAINAPKMAKDDKKIRDLTRGLYDVL